MRVPVARHCRQGAQPAVPEPVGGGRYGPAMDAFETDEIASRRAAAGAPYLEFLRSPSLSVGLYVLAPGEADLQSPHREDEVYVVERGAAQIEVAGERRPVGPGSVVYVAKGVDHRFVDITEELRVVVLFAPPETSA
jgi:mannose-6-phosphate isomerase-like protein (cupin superfamily)